MPSTQDYLAIDLGASSGRSLLGRFDGRSIHLTETHRFHNRAIPVGNALYWDFLGLYGEVLTAIRKSAEKGTVASIGIDTWGVDFGLLDRNDEIISSPRCYRDPRTQGMLDAVLEIVPRDRVFDQTGIQFLEINTLYQLFAMVREKSPQLTGAETFLTVPDLLNFLLTGSKVCRILERHHHPMLQSSGTTMGDRTARCPFDSICHIPRHRHARNPTRPAPAFCGAGNRRRFDRRDCAGLPRHGLCRRGRSNDFSRRAIYILRHVVSNGSRDP